MLNWSVDESKNEFRKQIMKIEDEQLRNVCLTMMGDTDDKEFVVPDYFWVVPASSSGKYHPECDLGDGGLVRHSIMVCTVGCDFVTNEMFIRDNSVNRDITRVACLFHDCLKSGLVDENGNYSEHTVFEHPILARDFVRKALTKANIDELKIEMICGAIYTHMGKWCVSRDGKTNMSKPRTDFERLVHNADYVASRKYISGLAEWETE